MVMVADQLPDPGVGLNKLTELPCPGSDCDTVFTDLDYGNRAIGHFTVSQRELSGFGLEVRMALVEEHNGESYKVI
jgi:hypothetical protein